MIIEHPLILASSSPRRQYLLQEAGFTFTVQKPEVDEDFPTSIPIHDVAKYLAHKKATSFHSIITNEIVITADTVVILNNKILNKPVDREEAVEMLQSLAGNTHHVMTGVCLYSKEKRELFDDITEVTFAPLTSEEIAFYVEHYKPFDKAGAYGAQDWIGMVAIEKIVGSYFNVMGLPVHKVYAKLKNW
jgi:septum formation protein